MDEPENPGTGDGHDKRERWRTKFGLIACAVVIFLGGNIAPAASDVRGVIARHPAADGGWDYLSIDKVFDRIYVGRETGILALDRRTGRIDERFIDGRNTAEVLLLPDGRTALTTHPDDKLIGFFDRQTGKVLAEIRTDSGPDAAILNPRGTAAYVMNHEAGTISVVDLNARRIVRRIKVGGKLESGAFDNRGRLFVNVEDTSSVVVIERATGKIARRISLPKCVGPTAIGIGAAGFLYTVCSNGRLVVINTAVLKVVGSVTIGKDADGLAIDLVRRRLYTSNGDGSVSELSLEDPRRPRPRATLPTIRNGRTLALDASNRKLYIAGGPNNADEAKTGHFEIVELNVAP